MEIVYHLGVHLTDEDKLPRTLLRNRATLAQEGIIVPWPRQYRYLFKDLVGRLNGAKASREMQLLILDAVMEQDHPARVIFGNESFLSLRTEAVAEGKFYPKAGQVVRSLRNIFPDNPVRFCLAVRSPATFLPALAAANPSTEGMTLPGNVDPAALRWSELIGRIAEAVPDCPVTFWCDEDSPVLWPVILRAVSGHSPELRLTHTLGLLEGLMRPEGFARMRTYFAEHPPPSEERRRRAVAAFLEKFGRPEKLEMDLEATGWSMNYVEALTAAYDADIFEAAAIPGVTLIG